MQSLNRFRFAKIKMSLPCNWDAMELKSFQFNRGRKCIFSLIALLFILESTSASVCSSISKSLFASTSSRYFSSLPNDFQYSEILKGKTCVWRIIAPTDNHFIKILFKYFNLEDNYGSCSSTDDSLEIRDGSSSSSDLVNIYCQQNIPELNKGIFSSGRYLYLKLKSNYSQNSSKDTGFSIWYTAISKVTTCSSGHSYAQNGNIILSGSSGTIQSPIFPFAFRNRVKCIWRIKLSSNNYIVKISFTSLTLGSSFDSTCPTNNEYLEIFDGYNVSDGVSLGRFCGTKVPPNIYTRGNKLTVVFKSDNFAGRKGFSASYSSVSSSGTRGSCTAPYVKNSIYLRNSAGVIASPNYPADYARYMDCTWRINVPSGKRVKLYFLGAFKLESNCEVFNNDYVQIRDGLSSISSSLGKFCGNSKPQPVLTSSSSATVQFKTDSGTQHKGFYLVYEVYERNVPREGHCYPITSSTQTFEMTNTFGTIMSPNYPSNYPEDMECVWKVSVRDGKRVKFFMEGWNLDCFDDYVQVRDGYYSYSSELKTYCGYSSCAEPAIYSTDRYMWIKFQSGFYDVSSRGFKAKFSEVEKSGALTGASIGMIVGIVIGVVIFIAIVIAIAFYCYNKNRNTGAVNRPEMLNLS